MVQIDDIFRAASPPATASAQLGFLQDLPGRWQGKGFNLIARPAKQGVAANPIFFWNSMAHKRRSNLPPSVATFPIEGTSSPPFFCMASTTCRR